jgi:predicted phage terminase large subunit-like protein
MRSVNKGGRGWRSLTTKALREETDGSLSSYWSSEWPVAKLLTKRSELGTPLFLCVFQNDLTGLLAGNVFQKRTFRYYDELPRDRLTVRMGVDLASSEKERADYTARVTTAEDSQGNLYVMSFYRDRREAGHASFIADGWQAYPDMALVVVENQQFQSTLIQEVMAAYPRIPIEGKRSDIDKTMRARAVAAKYEAGKVFHHRSLEGSDLETEMLGFPKGHDDLVDALGFSMDMGGGGLVFGSLRRQ